MLVVDLPLQQFHPKVVINMKNPILNDRCVSDLSRQLTDRRRTDQQLPFYSTVR